MDNSTPFITVVTGYYNRTENLKESVQSILDQTYSNFEYIIFDDCSTDGTYDLLQTIRDPRIRLIRHEKNLGFTKGVYNAITFAKGQFIAIHGAGDLSKPFRLEKQVQILVEKPEIGIVSCDREEFDGDKVTTHINKNTNINFVKGILYRNFIVHGEVMFRKSIYDKVGGYDPWITYAQDRDLWIRMRTHCGFYRIPEILYSRGVFKESVSQNLSKRIQQRFFTCISREREIKGNKFSLLFRDRYQILADEAIIMHYRNRKSVHGPILLEVCKKESWDLMNKIYYRFHWLSIVNKYIYRKVVARVDATNSYLATHLEDMNDAEIYETAVLRKQVRK